MISLDEVIEATLLNIENYKKHIKKAEKNLAEVRRKKWWLQHPEVAYFTARTSWEIEEWSRESYLEFYVESVIGIDGSEVDFHSEPLYFYEFPSIEEDILDDDEQFIKYENPFLCT